MVTHRRSTKRRWVESTAAGKPFRIFNTLLMTLLSLLFAAPFLLIAIASLTPEVEIAAKGFQFFPSRLTLYNYQYLFGASARFTTAMRTTAILTVVGTLWSLFFTSMGAYAMSRTYLPYRKGLMFFVTLTMLINGGLIPWYMVVINLGLKDSMAAMIIPGTISVWNLIVMRNSFMAIPPSLEESARIDGANDLTIFFRIILPVSKPIIATMIVYTAVGYWNEWYSCMLFITRRDDLRTLQYLLREILNASASMNSRGAIDLRATASQAIPSESLKMAAVMVATVPILCVYPFLQKYFVHGIMIGSIKG